MIYLRSFRLSPKPPPHRHAYPYRTLKHHTGESLLFDRITVLYGHNGSGKSTLLNLIANKLDLKGKEDMTNHSNTIYPLDYMDECSFHTGDDSHEGESDLIPTGSRYLKSEDVLYEVKKIQQEEVMRESYLHKHAKSGYTPEQLEALEQSKRMYKQIEIMKFASEKYSNGETSMQWFEEYLVPNALYLLDEPETSLSPQNQIRLAEEINTLARYCDCQFIIASHSPFMLGTLMAKIYNLDTSPLRTCPWYELENVRFFYDFFMKHKMMFDE